MSISYGTVKKIRKIILLSAFGVIVYFAVTLDNPYQYVGGVTTALNMAKEKVAKLSVSEERKLIWKVVLLPGMLMSAMIGVGLALDVLKFFARKEINKIKFIYLSTGFYLIAFMPLFSIMPLLIRLISFQW